MQNKKAKSAKRERDAQEFGERLRQVMELKNIDAGNIIEGLRIDPSSMSLWSNGKRKAGPKNTRRLAKYLECNYDWLFSGDGPEPTPSFDDDPYHVAYLNKVGLKERESRLAHLVQIPVLGKVPADIPETVADYTETYVSIPDAPPNSYALKVHGQSMEPEIRHGDYVLFVIDKEARPGDVVVVNDEFGESMIKRFKEKDGEYYLVSDNPAYPTFKPNGDYRIMGVVVGGWRPLKI